MELVYVTTLSSVAPYDETFCNEILKYLFDMDAVFNNAEDGRVGRCKSSDKTLNLEVILATQNIAKTLANRVSDAIRVAKSSLDDDNDRSNDSINTVFISKLTSSTTTDNSIIELKRCHSNIFDN